MQVYGNLHWLKSTASNAFLFEDEDGFVLVDSGMPKRIDPVAYLQKLGHEPSALKHILVTHADIDHIGNVAKVQRATGAKVYAGAESAELLKNGKTPSHGKPLMMWISDRFMKYEAVEAELITVVEAGEQLPLMGGINVIAAPGHTPDQVVYHSATHGILFAGDALNTRGKKLNCSPKSISADYDLAKRSAIQLADLAPVIFACGHGTPYLHTFDDLMALFGTLRDQ